MEKKEIIAIVQGIVERSSKLKDNYTTEKNARVNYCCIFSHGTAEFEDILGVVKMMGKIMKETPSGPLFQIQQVETVSGQLKLLKIRLPDAAHPDRGDADFTVLNYVEFKKKYLGNPGFKLILRENFEMIELVDPAFDVRAYFSNSPLDLQLGIN
jgi:hypothetical protein